MDICAFLITAAVEGWFQGEPGIFAPVGPERGQDLPHAVTAYPNAS